MSHFWYRFLSPVDKENKLFFLFLCAGAQGHARSCFQDARADPRTGGHIELQIRIVTCPLLIHSSKRPLTTSCID